MQGARGIFMLRGPVEYRRRLSPPPDPPPPEGRGTGAIVAGLLLMALGGGLAAYLASGANIPPSAHWVERPQRTAQSPTPGQEIVRLSEGYGESRSHATRVIAEIGDPIDPAIDPADDATGAIPPEMTHAARAPVETAKPKLPITGPAEVAIIVDDLGLDPKSTDQVIALPTPLTLSFLPYGKLSRALARQASEAGHEVMLHLPMEPLGPEDPGPGALRTGQGPAELKARVERAVARIGNAVGVNNHMGSRLTRNPEAMRVVLEALSPHALYFVDSVTAPGSVAARTAAQIGMPAARRDVFLDHRRETGAIEVQLLELERVARARGSAIAIAHPHANTIAALRAWIAGAGEAGFRIVPASRIVARRTGAPMKLVQKR